MTAQEMQDRFGFTVVMSLSRAYSPGGIFTIGSTAGIHGDVPPGTQIVIKRKLSLAEIKAIVSEVGDEYRLFKRSARYYAAVAE